MSGLELNRFELGGVRFVADIRPGSQRGQSTDDEFVIVKTPPFIEFYQSLRDRSPRSILEIGMFEGGSMVLLDQIFEPSKIVGVDVRPPIPALEKYRAARPHMRTKYGLSQDDPDLGDVLNEEFPRGIDLIIDDASHHYEKTRKTLEIAFPHLNPGGLYVIEDWAWAHAPDQQDEAHPWYRRKALTNLVFELLVNLPRNGQMRSVDVRPELVAIEKAANASGPMDLGVGMRSLRGRQLNQL